MTSFPTPCGEVIILDESGNALEFDVHRRTNPFSRSYFFCGSDHAYPIQTKDEYEIHVPIKPMENGKYYQLQIRNCPCEFGGSDEGTICNYVFYNNYHLSIGAYNPNDEYDEEFFHQYWIHFLEDYSGYVFQILDRTFEEIVFPIAWIEHFTERPAVLRFVEEEELLQQFFSYITCLTT